MTSPRATGVEGIGRLMQGGIKEALEAIGGHKIGTEYNGDMVVVGAGLEGFGRGLGVEYSWGLVP